MFRRAVPVLCGVLVLAAAVIHAAADQRTVRTSKGWLTSGAGNQATAGAVVENGTMYDVYIVGAETDRAAKVELMHMSGGKATATKEVLVAAFDRLEMGPTGVFLSLIDLKRPLKSGETVTITLKTDGGETLTVEAVVK